MAIASGTFLGPYEVLAPLGAGGMGEVYRGKDSRLGREVAIKVLPPEFSSDAERLRRFEQEARATSLLNHPNILSVYDIGTHEGFPYVVSELLSGETLRQRIGGTPLPQRKAIEFALQIAHGLAAAHEKGIVHRDLKPENIFITRDGRVKILDFGLAKLTIPEPVSGAGSKLETLEPGTQPGIVLGTVGYMSPEQVRGRDVDERSDLFSLGAILYEMLTGRRAFQRDSTADTMSAILKEDPPDLSSTNKNIPAALERIIRHCLEKNAEERFQSARDLAFDLEMISGLSGTLASGQTVPIETTRKWKKFVAPLLILLTGTVIGFLLHTLLELRAIEQDTSFQRLSFRRGYVSGARVAPDGQSILYSATWGNEPNTIYTTRPQSPVSRSLGMSNVDLLSVSRNGEMAVLLNPKFEIGWQRTGTLAHVPIDGGAPREILENVQDADWASDGKDLAVARAFEGINRLEFPIGKVLYQTGGWISHVRISPSGKIIAFVDHPGSGDDRGFIAVVDLNGKKTVLTEEWLSASGLAWSSNGDEIWFTSSKEGSNQQPLRAVNLSGQERVVLDTAGNLVLHDVAKDGQVLITQDSRRREMIAFAAGDTRERDISWFDWSYPRDLSRDGKLVLFEEQGAGGGQNYSVYLRGMDGSPAVRLGDGYAIALSPDTKQALAVVPNQDRSPHLLATGAGQSRQIHLKDVRMQISASWLNDGNRVLFIGRQNDRPARVWLLDIRSETVKPVTAEGIGSTFVVSPDEGTVIVDIDNTHLLYDLSGGEPKKLSAVPPELTPIQWTSDGNSLYVIRNLELPIRIQVLNLQSGELKLWKEITPPDIAGIQLMGRFHITRDGESYVYTYRRVISDLYLAEGLK